MDTPRDWQLTRRFRCPTCDKRYAVVEWKLDAKCRQCGAALREEAGEQQSAKVSSRSPELDRN